MGHWARKGIVGRGVLADVARWRDHVGRPLQMAASDAVSAEELLATLEFQKTKVLPGDILLIHFGWPAFYEGLAEEVRAKLATLRAPRAPGLMAGRKMVETLWNLHVAAIAADNAQVEVAPFSAGLSPEEAAGRYNNLHQHLLPLLGNPAGRAVELRPAGRRLRPGRAL